jgi:hypothetical protein
MAKPKMFDALVRAGGPERFVREAAEQAANAERQRWLESLERAPSPKDAHLAELYVRYIRDLRRQLGIGQPLAVVREQTRERVQRKRALGDWGEKKTVDLLERAGFRNVRDMNAESANHPFGDIFAERDGIRYLIGVKTRNKYQVSGLINPTYNVRKRGAEVEAIARRHNATLAWVAVAVIPEEQIFSAFFGTIAQIEEAGERFSIPMMPEQTVRYECLSQPLEEYDESIRPEWSNGGYLNCQRRDFTVRSAKGMRKGANMTKTLNGLPADGTKDRKKLEAMVRLGPPHGAETRELQQIDGNGGWGTYKNDGKRYADFLGGTLHIWGEGKSKRYWIELPPHSKWRNYFAKSGVVAEPA